jgi:hypothetical protein
MRTASMRNSLTTVLDQLPKRATPAERVQSLWLDYRSRTRPTYDKSFSHNFSSSRDFMDTSPHCEDDSDAGISAVDLDGGGSAAAVGFVAPAMSAGCIGVNPVWWASKIPGAVHAAGESGL